MLCSFKQTPKSTVQAQWGNIQALYKKYCKLIYKLLNMYKRKKNNVVGKQSKFTHPILTCDT